MTQMKLLVHNKAQAKLILVISKNGQYSNYILFLNFYTMLVFLFILTLSKIDKDRKLAKIKYFEENRRGNKSQISLHRGRNDKLQAYHSNLKDQCAAKKLTGCSWADFISCKFMQVSGLRCTLLSTKTRVSNKEKIEQAEQNAVSDSPVTEESAGVRSLS